MTSHDKKTTDNKESQVIASDNSNNSNDDVVKEEKYRKNADTMLITIQDLGREIKPSCYGNIMAQERLKIGTEYDCFQILFLVISILSSDKKCRTKVTKILSSEKVSRTKILSE